jgi:hypothetical protein
MEKPGHHEHVIRRVAALRENWKTEGGAPSKMVINSLFD